MHSSLQCMQTHWRLLSCNTHTRTQSPDSATLLCTVCTTRITQVCSGTQLQCIAMSREYTCLHWLCDKHLGIALNRSMIGGKVAVVVKSLTCVVWFGFICCVRKVGVSILAESWKKIVGVAWHLFFVHQLQRFLCHKIDTGSPFIVHQFQRLRCHKIDTGGPSSVAERNASYVWWCGVAIGRTHHTDMGGLHGVWWCGVTIGWTHHTGTGAALGSPNRPGSWFLAFLCNFFKVLLLFNLLLKSH